MYIYIYIYRDTQFLDNPLWIILSTTHKHQRHIPNLWMPGVFVLLFSQDFSMLCIFSGSWDILRLSRPWLATRHTLVSRLVTTKIIKATATISPIIENSSLREPRSFVAPKKIKKLMKQHVYIYIYTCIHNIYICMYIYIIHISDFPKFFFTIYVWHTFLEVSESGKWRAYIGIMVVICWMLFHLEVTNLTHRWQPSNEHVLAFQSWKEMIMCDDLLFDYPNFNENSTIYPLVMTCYD